MKPSGLPSLNIYRFLIVTLFVVQLHNGRVFACEKCTRDAINQSTQHLRDATENVHYANRHEVVVYIPQDQSENEGNTNAGGTLSVSRIEEIARESGFYFGGPSGPKDHYLFYRSMEDRDESHGLTDAREITWWQEQFPKYRFKRDEDVSVDDEYQWTWPSDSLLKDQTHLVDPVSVPGGPSFSGNPVNLNVLDCWMAGVNGSGVTISIVDDGGQWDHPDLVGNYNEDFSFDWNYNDRDPRPHAYDSHGTSAIGLAAATRDSECGVGVAYGANFAVQRMLGAFPTDNIEANALSYHCRDGVDIYSCSWGPSDNGKTRENPGRLARLSMEECIAHGRNGKGSVYVWAAGNGRENGDNINYDGYASSRFTIPVGATDSHGVAAYYSEPGACLLVSAPSSSRYNGITTTDLTGYSGDSVADCTHRFGGTSAAAPMIAGVVALMLQVNPDLSWRDVKHILVHSSRPTDIENGQWHINGARLVHSHNYGFGIPDATDAVQKALNWRNVPSEIVLESDTIRPNLQIPKAGKRPSTARSTWFAPESQFELPIYLEHVSVNVRMDTPQGYGKIALQLCSPFGTCSILAPPGPGNGKSISWDYLSVRHWGEDVIDRTAMATWNNDEGNANNNNNNNNNANGNTHAPNEWRLNIMNVGKGHGDPVVLKEWKITFYGCRL